MMRVFLGRFCGLAGILNPACGSLKVAQSPRALLLCVQPAEQVDVGGVLLVARVAANVLLLAPLYLPHLLAVRVDAGLPVENSSQQACSRGFSPGCTAPTC